MSPPAAAGGGRAQRDRFPLSAPAEGLDEFPLPHPRAAGDALLLRLFVELLPCPVFERSARGPTAPPRGGRLPAEVLPDRLREFRDRPLAPCGLLCALDVPLRGPNLLRAGHPNSPPYVPTLVPYPVPRTATP